MPKDATKKDAGAKVIASPGVGIKPYEWFGVDLRHRDGQPQAIGDCPLCGKDGKFFVKASSPDDNRWDCKSCAASGNAYVFARSLWSIAQAGTTDEDLETLAQDRGLNNIRTLVEWGIVRSHLTGEWLIPAYSVDGKMNNLYRYIRQTDGRMRIMSPPGFKHHLHGIPLWKKDRKVVYLCEGIWDGCALWETIKSQPEDSIHHGANVLATPSSNVFDPAWLEMLAGHDLSFMYDNDHPRVINNKIVVGSGLQGTERAVGVICKSGQMPSSMSYLRWGEGGHDPRLPSGYDVRDSLTGDGPEEETRAKNLSALMSRVQPVPPKWTEAGSYCDSWKDLTNACRKAMKWTKGLDRAFSVMLASIASVASPGEQLWVKIVGPPGSGKSRLCEAVSANHTHIVAKSTMRGFHSGWKAGKGEDGSNDSSLLNKLRDKTLVTKDGDTLLQSPNLGQILSEARDIYDRVSRSDYRTGAGKDYEGVNMTWILCGTSSLRALDSSELGERFLDCVIMHGVDDDLEDEVLDRVFANTMANRGVKLNGRADTQHPPEVLEMHKKTEGFINYLKGSAMRLVKEVEWTETAIARIKRMSKFVAYFRARPSKKQEESSEREFASRLTGQLQMLADFLAVVLGKKDIDEEVMRRIRQVALDTARGKTMDIARHMEAKVDAGIDHKTLAVLVGMTPDKCHDYLLFLQKIGAIEQFRNKIAKGLQSSSRWRLMPKVATLYSEMELGGGTS